MFYYEIVETSLQRFNGVNVFLDKNHSFLAMTFLLFFYFFVVITDVNDDDDCLDVTTERSCNMRHETDKAFAI